MQFIPEWRDCKKVLCVRLDSMGDVLMTEPALRAIKETWGSHITLLTSPSGALAAQIVSSIDQVITFTAPWMKHVEASTAKEEKRLIDQLRREKYDGAVIFTVYSQNPLPAAHFCYLCEIPLRIAYCRENPYNLLSNWIPETEPHEQIRHEVQRQLDLVELIGCETTDHRIRVAVTSDQRLSVRRILEESRIQPTKPIIVVHPGATAESRRYPPEKFRRAIAELLHMNLQIVVTGSDKEWDLVEQICRPLKIGHQPGPVNLAGRLTVGELAALLETSRLLISNNTGTVHIAAGTGTPTVDLYALTNPQHTPWRVSHRLLYVDVPCRYCYKSKCAQGHNRCLRMIKTSDIIKASLELLNNQ